MSKTGNSIHIIEPRKGPGGLWVFDDPDKGISREPFVESVSDMIDILVNGLPDPETGFALMFSAKPFPGSQVTLVREEPKPGDTAYGETYHCEQLNMSGWLCPVLFKYFPKAPERIYASFMPGTGK